MAAREGYLIIDHQNAPGVPGGVGAGQVFESATRLCPHCQRIIVMNPLRQRERGRCTKCNTYVCDDCARASECRPFKAHLERVATAAAHGKQIPSLILPP